MCADHFVENSLFYFNKFDNLIQCSFYGDDHILSVSEDIPWFNMNNVALVFKNIGLDYTDFKKNDVFEDFVDICDLTFLKRKFYMCNNRMK